MIHFLYQGPSIFNRNITRFISLSIRVHIRPEETGLKEMFNVDIEYGHENSVDSLMCLKYVSFNNIFEVVDKDDSTCFRILKASLDTNSLHKPDTDN